MTSEFSIREVTTWKGFTNEFNALDSETWVYRGQSRDWPLASSLERRLKEWEIDLKKGAGIEGQPKLCCLVLVSSRFHADTP
jgi:hypothetical protein